jgi:hypothetical protein
MSKRGAFFVTTTGGKEPIVSKKTKPSEELQNGPVQRVRLIVHEPKKHAKTAALPIVMPTPQRPERPPPTEAEWSPVPGDIIQFTSKQPEPSEPEPQQPAKRSLIAALTAETQHVSSPLSPIPDPVIELPPPVAVETVPSHRRSGARKLTAACWDENGGIMVPIRDDNKLTGGKCSICGIFIADHGTHSYDGHVSYHTSKGDIAKPTAVAHLERDTESRYNFALAVATVLNHWPLSTCDTDGFRLFMGVVRPEWHVPSRHTLFRSYLRALYADFHFDLVDTLRRDCVFSIQFDAWKAGKAPGSNKHRGFVGITFCTIDGEWKQHVACIAIRRLKGSHTEKQILKLLKKVINIEYGISWFKVASLHTDNHNTECGVAAKICAESSGRTVHIRDFPHTVHLAVTDVVDGVPEVKHMAHVVRKIVGVFAKRRLVSERLESIHSKLQDGSASTLVQEVSVRWNSLLDSLERIYKLRDDVTTAINDELKSLGQSQAKDVVKLRDKLSRLVTQFNVVKINLPFLITILRHCKQASDAMEGDDGFVSQLIRVVDKLELKLHVRSMFPCLKCL